MTELFIAREKINRFMHEYETWFTILGKFIGMMFVFTYVNSSLGYFAQLDNFLVDILLSLICSIIPGSFSVFIVAAVVAAHMVKLSVVLALLTVIVMVVLYLMFLMFAPDQSIVILAVPVLMQYNLHYMVPIVAGMFFTPYAVVPAAIGMFMVKFMGYTCDAVELTGTGMSVDLEGIISALAQIVAQMTADREIWVFIIVGALTMAVMFVLGQFSFDYAWYVAILCGAVVQIFASFFCATTLGVSLSFIGVFIASILGALVAAFLQFMKCAVEYSRKEYLQFEDDEYYYYVKAIPKAAADILDEQKDKPKKAPKKKSKKHVDTED